MVDEPGSGEEAMLALGVSDAARAQIMEYTRRVSAADAVFTAMGVPHEWSDDVFRALDAQLRALTDESAILKREIEVIRDKRRAIIERMEPLLLARARLIEIRPAQPGDVTV